MMVSLASNKKLPLVLKGRPEYDSCHSLAANYRQRSMGTGNDEFELMSSAEHAKLPLFVQLQIQFSPSFALQSTGGLTLASGPQQFHIIAGDIAKFSCLAPAS